MYVKIHRHHVAGRVLAAAGLGVRVVEVDLHAGHPVRV